MNRTWLGQFRRIDPTEVASGSTLAINFLLIPDDVVYISVSYKKAPVVHRLHHIN